MALFCFQFEQVFFSSSVLVDSSYKDGSAFFGINPPGTTETEALRKCEERRNLQCLNSNKQEAV